MATPRRYLSEEEGSDRWRQTESPKIRRVFLQTRSRVGMIRGMVCKRHFWELADPEAPVSDDALFRCRFCEETATAMSWPGQLDPFEPDPLHDAVGKFIGRVHGLEIHLFMVTSDVTRGLTYRGAEKLGPNQCLRRLRDISADVPGEDRSEFQDVLEKAERVIELRNAVVHGIWVESADGQYRQSQRPARKSAEDWIHLNFDRPTLLLAAHQAWECMGFLQVQTRGWPQHLGLVDDDASA